MRRGEVWWGDASLAGPQRKRRPFLVVSDDAFNENASYPKVLAVHLTSAHRPSGPYAWEVDIPRGAARLPRASVAKCAEIYTLFKDQLVTRVGSLPRALLERVDRALTVALGLPIISVEND